MALPVFVDIVVVRCLSRPRAAAPLLPACYPLAAPYVDSQIKLRRRPALLPTSYPLAAGGGKAVWFIRAIVLVGQIIIGLDRLRVPVRRRVPLLWPQWC